METILITMMDFMSSYGVAYLKIQAIYQLIHQFLMGIAGNQWGTQSVIAGLFFPLSFLNELGFLGGLILSYITKRGPFEKEPEYLPNEPINYNNSVHNGNNNLNSEESLRFGPDELEREYGRKK